MPVVKRKQNQSGFSLVELAIVIVIVGLLLGSVLVPITVQMVNEKISSTEKTLQRVRDAVLGFAVINRRLPCPDTNGDGVEDGPNCNDLEGQVPWVSLGIGRSDAWGRPLRYRIDNSFNTSIANPPNTSSGLSIRNRAGLALSLADPNAPIAIIFSCGPDGKPNDENDADGSTNTDAQCSNSGTPNNIYTDDTYVKNQYDDLLIWISKNNLIHHLVNSGNWP